MKRVVETYVCDGCGKEMQKPEVVIIIGGKQMEYCSMVCAKLLAAAKSINAASAYPNVLYGKTVPAFKREGLTTGQAATYCGVSYTTINDWVKKNWLRCARTGNGLPNLFNMGDLDAIIKTRKEAIHLNIKSSRAIKNPVIGKARTLIETIWPYTIAGGQHEILFDGTVLYNALVAQEFLGFKNPESVHPAHVIGLKFFYKRKTLKGVPSTWYTMKELKKYKKLRHKNYVLRGKHAFATVKRKADQAELSMEPVQLPTGERCSKCVDYGLMNNIEPCASCFEKVAGSPKAGHFRLKVDLGGH